MKLAKYLSDHGLNEPAFAAKLGVGQATINRYVNNKRFPGPDMIERIRVATGGKVKVTDWYEQAAEARSEVAA